MSLPFLHKVYRPAGTPSTATPKYADTYREILKYQAKPDYSLRCILNGDKDGTVHSRGIRGGFDDDILPLIVHRGTIQTSMNLDAPEKNPVHTTRGIAGYSALVGIGSSVAEQCFPITGGGRIKMHQVWQGAEPHEQLFEGSFYLSTKNCPTLVRKGFGRGDTYKDHFWAVRARKNEKGEEIGCDHLDERAVYEDPGRVGGGSDIGDGVDEDPSSDSDGDPNLWQTRFLLDDDCW